jgi:hypothetical protein
MTFDLTRNLKKFACALPIDYCLVKDIKKDRLPYEGIKRVNWRELVNLGIAELYVCRSKIYLRRGSQWYMFFDQYGYADTHDGCISIEILSELSQQLKRNNIIRFPQRHTQSL